MAYNLESVRRDLEAISSVALVGVKEAEELNFLKLGPVDIGEDIDLKETLDSIRNLTESAIHTLTHMAKDE